MAQFDTLLQFDTDAPTALHIIAVTFFMVTGGILNSLIIFLKLRKYILHETDVYILALAGVDIFACVALCPQHPFIASYINWFAEDKPFALSQLMFCVSTVMFIYLQLLTIITVNRVYAVLKPHSFQSSVKRGCLIVASLAILGISHTVIVILFQDVIQHGNEITNVITVFEIALCFGSLSGSYILIFYKLYVRKKKVFQGSMEQNRNETNVRSQSSNVCQNKKTPAAIHIKTIKMFGVSTIIFL